VGKSNGTRTETNATDSPPPPVSRRLTSLSLSLLRPESSPTKAGQDPEGDTCPPSAPRAEQRSGGTHDSPHHTKSSSPCRTPSKKEGKHNLRFAAAQPANALFLVAHSLSLSHHPGPGDRQSELECSTRQSEQPGGAEEEGEFEGDNTHEQSRADQSPQTQATSAVAEHKTRRQSIAERGRTTNLQGCSNRGEARQLVREDASRCRGGLLRRRRCGRRG
jgi:hypothetical protein